MPNIQSAKKRVRQTARKTGINRARRSRIRTFLKRVELAISAADKNRATEALISAQTEIMRGVSRGVVHKNTASRKVSRLSNRIRSLP